MKKELAKAGEWEEQINLIKDTVAKGATDMELKLFLHQCKKTGLDPLAHQIYLVKRWNNKLKKNDMTIQTGIDGYRVVADRTGKYAGSDDYKFDEGLTEYKMLQEKKTQPTTATVSVYKMVNNVRCSFTATARWDEYYPGDKQGFMWKKMPFLMLGKCAEALALRKAFPQELSGVYVKEEMEQAGIEEIKLLANPEILSEIDAELVRYDDTINERVKGQLENISQEKAEQMLKDLKNPNEALKKHFTEKISDKTTDKKPDKSTKSTEELTKQQLFGLKLTGSKKLGFKGSHTLTDEKKKLGEEQIKDPNFKTGMVVDDIKKTIARRKEIEKILTDSNGAYKGVKIAGKVLKRIEEIADDNEKIQALADKIDWNADSESILAYLNEQEKKGKKTLF